MPIELREIRTTGEIRRFITFAEKLYRGNPHYVPALKMDEMNILHPDKNPSFAHCDARYWLAFREGKIVGRVAGILNHKHREKWGEAYLRFGWLDFVDDPAVSAALLGAVEDWARKLGLEAVHGPLGFTDLDREGMLVEGFDELGTLATLYNYPYYPEHLARLGYSKDTDWVEYELQVPDVLDEKITRAAGIVLKRNNLHFLEVNNKQELLDYAPRIFQLINEEYSHLYGTVPLTDAEIQMYTDAYFGFVNPDFVPIILNAEGEMAAFGVTIPSLSRALQQCRGNLFPLGWWRLLRALQKNTRADLYLVAVRKRYQGLGVNLALMARVHRVFVSRGIQVAESNPELEDNVDVQSQWKLMERRQHKRRRVFIKRLGAAI
jgi:GNAT superfamily N-acetyltransferase